VTGYSVAPALPAGLSFSLTTGVITGTPTAVTATGSYVVTASNSGGSTTATLSITVNDVAPSGLIYSSNPAVYTKGVAITANTPSNSGGAVTGYSVAPALPAGLSFSLTTGVITGTPTAVTATGSYVVTASNSGGSTTATLSITVNDLAPSSLIYSSNPAIYTNGVAITANTPSNSGGTVTGYSVAPALPAGLSFSVTTGVITGTPTAITATGSYVVTGSNSGGSTTASVSITVNDVAPSNLSYLANPANYTVGTAITPNTPTSSGGAVTAYTVAPSLPTGLALDPTLGAISGTPTAVTATASYVVTASNTGGSTTASVSITVAASGSMSIGVPAGPALPTRFASRLPGRSPLSPPCRLKRRVNRLPSPLSPWEGSLMSRNLVRPRYRLTPSAGQRER
jgi:hypothetical protein